VLERTIRRYNPTTNWRFERDRLKQMAEEILARLPPENSRERLFLTNEVVGIRESQWKNMSVQDIQRIEAEIRK
jgi:hypothetical protein